MIDGRTRTKTFFSCVVAYPAAVRLFPLDANIWNRLLVMPATNAASVSSFSAARRARRSTMSRQCLNHLMLLHLDKGTSTASINLVDVANDFIASKDHMINYELLCTNIVWFLE